MSPICLRLTVSERERLIAAAGNRSMSAYIRSRLFEAEDRRRPVRRPQADQLLLGQVLAQLGRSDIVVGIRELGEAARVGALPVSPESETAIRTACQHVTELRTMLVRALGLLERPDG